MTLINPRNHPKGKLWVGYISDERKEIKQSAETDQNATCLAEWETKESLALFCFNQKDIKAKHGGAKLITRPSLPHTNSLGF